MKDTEKTVPNPAKQAHRRVNKMMKKTAVLPAVLPLIVGLAIYASAANATSVGTGGISTAFSKGTTSVAVTAGSGGSFNDSYFVLGLGVGYYFMKGLEVGIDAQHWFSGSPSITKISPQVRYVFTQPKVIKPYVGAFYRRTFVDSDFFDDINSYGYRAGAYFSTNNKVYVGGGIVYEQYSGCEIDCSNTYPEVLFTVSF